MSTTRPDVRSRSNRIRGALYGFAIGDAMGATTEFYDKAYIRKHHGFVDDLIGGGVFNWAPGQTTDDTAMMLCVCKALMEMPSQQSSYGFAKACAERFLEWYDTKPKDIGLQCMRALVEFRTSGNVVCAGDEMALGNGSLMRALPCALFGSLGLNILQSVVTHNNTTCIRCVTDFHDTVQTLLAGKAIKVQQKVPRAPTGYVKSTLDNACYWATTKPTFYDAVTGAVNDGGDADTIAALAGALAGLRFGYNAIPTKWLNKLDPVVGCQLAEFVDFLLSKEEVHHERRGRHSGLV